MSGDTFRGAFTPPTPLERVALREKRAREQAERDEVARQNAEAWKRNASPEDLAELERLRRSVGGKLL